MIPTFLFGDCTTVFSASFHFVKSGKENVRSEMKGKLLLVFEIFLFIIFLYRR